MTKNTTLTEFEECKLLVEYLELKKIKFTHLAQSTFTKSWATKTKNRQLGVRAGFPDYAIIFDYPSVKKKALVFLEMKRTKGGVVSDEQKVWLEDLNDCNGVSAYIAKGFDEAKEIVDKFNGES